jgi:hypothetical protein
MAGEGGASAVTNEVVVTDAGAIEKATAGSWKQQMLLLN